MSSKLRQVDALFEYCIAWAFTAYDPPHALTSKPALLAPIPAGDPKPAPAPSHKESKLFNNSLMASLLLALP